MLLLVALVRTSLIDDAYITLDYAKNLALHLHWGVIPHHVANTATSPLNVLLLGTMSAATRISGDAHPVVALAIVSVAEASAIAWAWTRIARVLALPFATTVLGTALLVLDPILLSSMGLEVLLVATVLILLLATALEGRAGWFGVLAGLALLARLDLIVFALLIAAATPAIRAKIGRAAIAATVVAAPWFAFSWVYFGSALPDTVVIKLSQHDILGKWTYLTGPALYTRHFPAATVLAFAPALVGAAALAAFCVPRLRASLAQDIKPLRPALALAAAGVLYYTVYSALRVTPYHWYYVAPLVSLAAFAAIAAGVAARDARHTIALPRLATALLAALALGALVRDVSQGVPWREPLVTTNFAVASQYARIGTALHRLIGDAPVRSPAEIGTLAYFCECQIIDEFSDRGAALPLIDERRRTGAGWTQPLLDVNYAFLRREKPPRLKYALGYVPPPGRPGGWPTNSPWRGHGHIVLERAP